MIVDRLPFVFHIHETGLAPERIPYEVAEFFPGQMILFRENLLEGEAGLFLDCLPEGAHNHRLDWLLEEQPDMRPIPRLRKFNEGRKAKLGEKDGGCFNLGFPVGVWIVGETLQTTFDEWNRELERISDRFTILERERKHEQSKTPRKK